MPRHGREATNAQAAAMALIHCSDKTPVYSRCLGGHRRYIGDIYPKIGNIPGVIGNIPGCEVPIEGDSQIYTPRRF